MMKERPILMSGPMVRAILGGRKTQTRRTWTLPSWAEWDLMDGGEAAGRLIPKDPANRGWYSVDEVACPYGQSGDRLWVRETWRTDSSLDYKAPREFSAWPVKYEADGAVLRHNAFFGNTNGKTRGSIHMPRWASRITLEVTGVRVERLRDISEADAEDEGCTADPCDGPTFYDEFASLWRQLNGAESWAANPWVWVIKFRRIPA